MAQHKELDSSDHDQKHNEDWHAFLHKTHNHNHDHSNGHTEAYSGYFDLSVGFRQENYHSH